MDDIEFGNLRVVFYGVVGVKGKHGIDLEDPNERRQCQDPSLIAGAALGKVRL